MSLDVLVLLKKLAMETTLALIQNPTTLSNGILCREMQYHHTSHCDNRTATIALCNVLHICNTNKGINTCQSTPIFLNVLSLLFSSMLPFSLSSSYQINFGFEHCFASDKSSKPASIMPDDVQIQTAQRSPSQFFVQNNSPVQFSIIIPVTK